MMNKGASSVIGGDRKGEGEEEEGRRRARAEAGEFGRRGRGNKMPHQLRCHEPS